MTEKVAWIDCTKSIALFFIICTHSFDYNPLINMITGFVIPVFFIMYGFTHNNEKYRYKLQVLYRKRFKSIMIPFLILTISIVILYYFFYPLIDIGYSPEEYTYWLIYGNGPPVWVSHLWFLKALFFAIVLFTVIDRILHDKNISFRLFLILFLPLFSVYLKDLLNVYLMIGGIDSIFIGTSFLLIGNEIKKIQGLNHWSINTRIDVLLFVLLTPIMLFLGYVNGFANIGASLYGNSILLHMTSGILGAYVIGLISYHLCKFERIKSALVSFNQYGQEIYEIHPFLTKWDFWIFKNFQILNLLNGVIVSWIISSQVIDRSRILKFIFTGNTRTSMRKSVDELEEQQSN
ncbi:MAG: acyltransferase family protein [Candidatus Lokiarchaeota archaeon]|nr:acyltransferase family protein [Candidatus Lokiarchaeota archaeon]